MHTHGSEAFSLIWYKAVTVFSCVRFNNVPGSYSKCNVLNSWEFMVVLKNVSDHFFNFRLQKLFLTFKKLNLQ